MSAGPRRREGGADSLPHELRKVQEQIPQVPVKVGMSGSESSMWSSLASELVGWTGLFRNEPESTVTTASEESSTAQATLAVGAEVRLDSCDLVHVTPLREQ